MMSKRGPSWICHLGFQIFSQTSENSQKLLKSTQKQSNDSKRSERMKITALTLIFINKNTKLTNLENTSVKMRLPWQFQVPDTATCLIKLILNKFYTKSQSLAAFGWIFKTVINVQSQHGLFSPYPRTG